MKAIFFLPLFVVGVLSASSLGAFPGRAVTSGRSSDCPESTEFHLLKHETECGKFYICSAGTKHEMTCAPGTLFDYDLQTCNHESEVICSNECTEDIDFQLQNHESDCSKFYICSRATRWEMDCAPGTLFDFSLQTCNHENLVTCNTGSASKVSVESPAIPSRTNPTPGKPTGVLF